MADVSQGAETRPRALSRKVLSKTRLVKSFGFAWAGLSYAWRKEPNFRIEIFIGMAALGLALWLGVSPVPILLCCALVLALELINSALEAAIDLVSPELHPLAKLTKDAAAGAVLLTAIIATMVGLWTLGPALWHKLSGLF